MKTIRVTGSCTLTLVVAIAAAACSSGGTGEAEAIGYKADGLLHCGSEPALGQNGEAAEHEIVFSYGELEAAIKEKGITDRLGFSAVESCEQARVASVELEKLSQLEPELLDNNVYPTEEEKGEKIANGSGSAFIPALEITVLNNDGNASTCTGALLNRRVAVTAAHCLDGVLNPANTQHETKTNQSVKVSLYRPADKSWTCLTSGGAAGKCGSFGTANFTMHGGYTGAVNANWDIGIVWLSPGTHWATHSDDYLRVYMSSLSNFDGFQWTGRGPNTDTGENSGIMRWGGFGMDSFGDYSFTSEVRTPRMCAGDSGGPATVQNCDPANPADCAPNLIGLLSNMTYTKTPTDLCANSPGETHGVRMSGGQNFKINWVKETTSTSCSTYTGSLGNYVRCF